MAQVAFAGKSSPVGWAKCSAQELQPRNLLLFAFDRYSQFALSVYIEPPLLIKNFFEILFTKRANG